MEAQAEASVILVGDQNIGKSKAIQEYLYGVHPDSYTPTVLEEYTANITVYSHNIAIKIVDTSGTQKHQVFREKFFPEVDVILVCFSCQRSFSSVTNKWHRELKSNAPNTPVLLVELEDSQVLHTQAWSLCSELGYEAFLPKCSSKQVFDAAFKLALSEKLRCGKKKGKCITF